jgi:hypothetical protein
MCHIGTWSTRYCMRTVEKIWRPKGGKKIRVCRVLKNYTRQRPSLPSARCLPSACSLALGKDTPLPSVLFLALGKEGLCRVPDVCRVLYLWNSAKTLFAECPIKSTRQSMGHSAKTPSPVVKTQFHHVAVNVHDLVAAAPYQRHMN